MILKNNKNFVPKEKWFNILRNILKNVKVLKDTLTKMLQTTFADSLISEHSKHFFLF